MLLAKRCVINPNKQQSIVLNSLTYAARKLWNVGNYERQNWTKDSGIPYPDWYEQKKRLKSHFWYKNLPSQSAQELLKTLHGSWQSFYKLKNTGSIKYPRPPGYKQHNFNIRFLNNGFKVLAGNKLQLSLPSQLKKYLKEKYGFKEKYLIVDVPNHLQLGAEKVKIVEFKPLSGGKYELFCVVERPDVEAAPSGGKFMSIDIGVANFMTCCLYDGTSHIFSGRQLLSVNRYFDKTIGYYSIISDAQQSARGIKHPRQSKRAGQLYEKRCRQVYHMLHAMTRAVVDLAHAKNVDTIVIGDITGIRENKNLGRVVNQRFHRLPYKKAVDQIKYKATLLGIRVRSDIKENYTSQTCCACKDSPSKENAVKSNRRHRGLYVCKDCGTAINADVNGAANIAKKYLEAESIQRPVVVLGIPVVYRFNGLKFAA